MPSVAPARRCAFLVLRRTFEEGAYTDRALQAEAGRAELDARDRALAMQLAHGTVQRTGALDHVIAELAGRSVDKLDPAVRTALRLGLFQLLYLDTIPPHAAVGESVQLARDAGSRGHGLVNAILRRAAQQGGDLLLGLSDETPANAAVAHSHPQWIVDVWWEALGAEETRALLAADNEPAESALRVNGLLTDQRTLLAELRAAGVVARFGEPHPDAILLSSPFDAHGSPLWERGAFMPQSRAAMLVSRVLDPRPGERVLDLCAAPGGKTTHMAALMEGKGTIVAVERNEKRAHELRRTVARMGAKDAVQVVTSDARTPPPGPYDRVLVDPPCSGLGTLRSRPDLRWRIDPEQVDELAALQLRILEAGAQELRPGGVLVYATCTISSPENEAVVDAFLARHAEFAADDLQSDAPLWKHPRVPGHLLTLPHRDGTDGFFITRLRRRES